MQRIERAEMMIIRWMCEVTLRDRRWNEELRRSLDILSACDRVRQGTLRWFGRVELKDRLLGVSMWR